MTFRDAIAYSRNIAAARSRCVWTDSGQGRREALLDLEALRDRAAQRDRCPARCRGIAQDPRRTPSGSRSTLPTAPSGSPWPSPRSSLRTGYAAMVNGGFRVQPHMLAVDRTGRTGGKRPNRSASSAPIACGQLKGILHHVTASVPWYAEGSLIPGYQIGGKTGTAQIWDSHERQVHEEPLQLQLRRFTAARRHAAVIVAAHRGRRAQGQRQGDLQMGITLLSAFPAASRPTRSAPRRPEVDRPRVRACPEPGCAAQQALYPMPTPHGSTGRLETGRAAGRRRPAGACPDPSPTPRR